MSLPTLSAWGHETEWTFGVTRDEERERESGSSPPQVTVQVSAVRGLGRCRDSGGRTTIASAAGAFSRGGGGGAESQICHASHLSPALRGLKQKRKRMRLAGRPVPGAVLVTSSRTLGHLPVPARAQTRVKPWPSSGSGAAGSVTSQRCCCYCCSGRQRHRK
uniref:Interleukin 15 receptor subunit alpha n=1 Tax=Molossus molossus TaxID=27622 RepID=A0A7J8JU37_MOLMO|nr:interleukin 15 receptor subunit alpha [Molossus molossus]